MHVHRRKLRVVRICLPTPPAPGPSDHLACLLDTIHACEHSSVVITGIQGGCVTYLAFVIALSFTRGLRHNEGQAPWVTTDTAAADPRDTTRHHVGLCLIA